MFQTGRIYLHCRPPMYDRTGRPAMNKLLAYGYANEWEGARDNWYQKVIESKQYIYIQCSPLNSNSREPIKFVLIMRCSNYKFALNIKRKYNRLSKDHNHLSELTGFLN